MFWFSYAWKMYHNEQWCSLRSLNSFVNMIFIRKIGELNDKMSEWSFSFLFGFFFVTLFAKNLIFLAFFTFIYRPWNLISFVFLNICCFLCEFSFCFILWIIWWFSLFIDIELGLHVQFLFCWCKKFCFIYFCIVGL